MSILGGGNLESVTLAGITALEVTSSDDESIELVADNSTDAQVGDVVITNDEGVVVTRLDGWQYKQQATISSVEPGSGQAGTRATIHGDGLLMGSDELSSIKLNGVAVAGDPISLSDTAIVVIVPASDSAGTGSVELTNVEGAFVEDGEFEFVEPAEITGSSPADGQGGTRVTIAGTGMRQGGANITAVYLDDVEAEIQSESDTTVVVVAAVSGARSGDVKIVSDTFAFATLENAWTYLTPGSITDVSPSSGQIGSVVTITGTSMLGGADNADTVLLNGVEATIKSASNTKIVVEVAEGDAGTGAIEITATSGSYVVGDNAFTYIEAGKITDVSPAEGQYGTEVTITGSNLRGGADSVKTVTLAGVEALITDESNTEVDVIVAHSDDTGAGDIVMTADTGALVVSEDGWKYLELGVIESVDPAAGQAGTVATIAGQRLFGGGDGVASVTLGSTAAASIDSESSSEIVVTIDQADAADDVDVVLVSNTGAIITLEGGWTYLLNGNIESLFPTSGQEGTRVEIVGIDLFGGGTDVVSVTLAGTEAAEILSATNEVVVVEVADSASQTGDVVIVSDSGGVVTKKNGFTVFDAGTITSEEPNIGQLGTMVTISGTGLLGGGSAFTYITVRGQPVLDVIHESDELLIVRIASSQEVGLSDIQLSSNTGSEVTKVDSWTYNSPSEISKVTPSSGQHGTVVTLSGSNMLGPNGNAIAYVSLAEVSATIVSGDSQSEVIVVVEEPDSGGEFTGDIYIRSDSGAITVLGDSWKYLEEGVVTGISPSIGQGGTSVTIVGKRLLGGGDNLVSVTLAGTTASIKLSNSTYIVVVAADSSATSGEVVLTADSGAIIHLDNAWEYAEPGNVVSVEPSQGQVGTTVAISGSNLHGQGTQVVTVTLAGVEATIESETNTDVIVTAVRSDPKSGDAVLVADTGATITEEDSWRYLSEGEIDAATPSSGQTGTRVVISGSGLQGGGTSVDVATLVGTEATITSENDTHVLVEVKVGPIREETGDIVLTADTGAVVTGTNAFKYLDTPEVLSVSPSSGRVAAEVQIVGSLCGGGTNIVAVYLAGFEAVIDPDETDCKVATVAAGDLGKNQTGDVTLISDTGAIATAVDAWYHMADGAITNVEPPAGQGNSVVTITGSLMLGGGDAAPVVTMGGAETIIKSFSESEIIVITSSSDTGGAGDIVITGSSGVVTRGINEWFYSLVESVTPASGQRGTIITIKGDALLANRNEVPHVRLSSAEVAEVLTASDTEITARVNAVQVEGDVVNDLTITLSNGQIISGSELFTYKIAGSIDSVVPVSGQVGTRVTITGTNLLGYGEGTLTTVNLAGVDATEIVSATDEEVVVVAGASVARHRREATIGNIILTADSGATVVLQDGTVNLDAGGWEYVDPQVISSVSPAAGQRDTKVTISGSSLLGGADNVVSIELGGFEVTEIVSDTDEEVIVIAAPLVREPSCDDGEHLFEAACVSDCPAGSYASEAEDGGSRCQPCHGSCKTCSDGGSEDCSSCAAAMLLDEGSCTSHCYASGDAMFREGQGCSDCHSDCSSCVGGEASDCVECSDSDKILHNNECIESCPESMYHDEDANVCRPCMLNCKECTSDEFCLDVTGPSDVVLVTDTGSWVKAEDSWSYNAEGRIESVTPAEGQVGTKVVIEGKALRGSGDNVETVTLADVDATIVAEGNGQVVVVAKQGDEGSGDVVLTSSSGATITLADGWTFAAEGDITDVSPAKGQYGTKVAISGTSLLGGGTTVASLTVNGVDAKSVGDASADLIELVIDSGSAGTGAIVITSDSGAIVTKADAFEYLDEAVFDDVTPNSGQIGTKVVISGSGMLQGGTEAETVSFGSISTTIESGSDTEIKVTVDASGTADEVADIVVVADTGSVATATDAYTSVAAGEIADVEPTSGQDGTVVTLSGSGMFGGGSGVVQVTLAGVEAAISNGASATSIEVIAAAPDSSGSGDVVLIADTGAIVTLENGWKYVDAGEITEISPASGQVGTRVTIYGTNMLGGGATIDSVKLAGVEVDEIVSSSDEKVEVIAAASVFAEGEVILVSDTGAVTEKPYNCDE